MDNSSTGNTKVSVNAQQPANPSNIDGSQESEISKSASSSDKGVELNSEFVLDSIKKLRDNQSEEIHSGFKELKDAKGTKVSDIIQKMQDNLSITQGAISTFEKLGKDGKERARVLLADSDLDSTDRTLEEMYKENKVAAVAFAGSREHANALAVSHHGSYPSPKLFMSLPSTTLFLAQNAMQNVHRPNAQKFIHPAPLVEALNKSEVHRNKELRLVFTTMYFRLKEYKECQEVLQKMKEMSESESGSEEQEKLEKRFLQIQTNPMLSLALAVNQRTAPIHLISASKIFTAGELGVLEGLTESVWQNHKSMWSSCMVCQRSGESWAVKGAGAHVVLTPDGKVLEPDSEEGEYKEVDGQVSDKEKLGWNAVEVQKGKEKKIIYHIPGDQVKKKITSSDYIVLPTLKKGTWAAASLLCGTCDASGNHVSYINDLGVASDKENLDQLYRLFNPQRVIISHGDNDHTGGWVLTKEQQPYVLGGEKLNVVHWATSNVFGSGGLAKTEGEAANTADSGKNDGASGSEKGSGCIAHRVVRSELELAKEIKETEEIKMPNFFLLGRNNVNKKSDNWETYLSENFEVKSSSDVLEGINVKKDGKKYYETNNIRVISLCSDPNQQAEVTKSGKVTDAKGKAECGIVFGACAKEKVQQLIGLLNNEQAITWEDVQKVLFKGLPSQSKFRICPKTGTLNSLPKDITREYLSENFNKISIKNKSKNWELVTGFPSPFSGEVKTEIYIENGYRVYIEKLQAVDQEVLRNWILDEDSVVSENSDKANAQSLCVYFTSGTASLANQINLLTVGDLPVKEQREVPAQMVLTDAFCQLSLVKMQEDEERKKMQEDERKRALEVSNPEGPSTAKPETEVKSEPATVKAEVKQEVTP